MVERVASKVLPLNGCQAPALKTGDVTNKCDDVTDKRCDTTALCCDVTRSQLVTEVFEYMSANNPSTMWRTEREKKLLEAGLQSLSKEQRDTLKNERILYKIEGS